jgi:hypothetical protein
MNYGTVAGADAYHAARGNVSWDGTPEAKEIALLRGSEYIDNNFRSSFPGWKAQLRAQEREWPRSWAFDIEGNTIPIDEVPDEVERATYEAAVRELANPGILFPDMEAPGRQIKAASVDGAVSVQYTGPQGIQSVTPIISIIRGILAPILTGRGGSSLAGQSIRS